MWCRFLKEVDGNTRFGGKAANLRRVQDLGLCVPETYVVECSALTLYLEESGLRSRVAEYLGNWERRNSEELANSYSDLCTQARTKPLPTELESECARSRRISYRVQATV